MIVPRAPYRRGLQPPKWRELTYGLVERRDRRHGVAMGVNELVREVRSYCEFVDKASTLPLNMRLGTARTRLLALYSEVLSLPEGEHGDAPEFPQHERPMDWVGFGEKDHYWEIFDPYVDDERVGGSLSDDVLDIYDEVRDGLAYWDAGNTERAIWQWRFGFETHWGDHAVDALRALHRACRWRV